MTTTSPQVLGNYPAKTFVSWHDMIVSSRDTVVSCHDMVVSSCAVIAEYVKGGMQIRMLTVSFVYMFLR